jgi:hypothetical protein
MCRKIFGEPRNLTPADILTIADALKNEALEIAQELAKEQDTEEMNLILDRLSRVREAHLQVTGRSIMEPEDRFPFL